MTSVVTSECRADSLHSTESLMNIEIIVMIKSFNDRLTNDIFSFNNRAQLFYTYQKIVSQAEMADSINPDQTAPNEKMVLQGEHVYSYCRSCRLACMCVYSLIRACAVHQHTGLIKVSLSGLITVIRLLMLMLLKNVYW